MPSTRATAIALTAMSASQGNAADFHVVLPTTTYTIDATATATQPASTSRPTATVVPALNCPKYELLTQPPSPLLCGVPGVPSGHDIRALNADSLDYCIKRCYENPDCQMVGFKDTVTPDATSNCYLWGQHSIQEGNRNTQTLYYHVDCFTCNPIRRGPKSLEARSQPVEDLGGQYKYCGKRRAKRQPRKDTKQETGFLAEWVIVPP